MENTVKDRLIELAESLGMSARKLEDSIGASTGWISHVGKRVTADKMQKIAEKYPNVNPIWLQTGKGDMFLQTGDTSAQNVANAPHNAGTINQTSADATLYQKLVKVMEEQIDMLKQEKAAFLAKYGCSSFDELEKKMEDLKK